MSSRSQAENYIGLGKVLTSRDGRDWQVAKKSGEFVDDNILAKVEIEEQFVSRAALKLKSVAEKLNVDFREKVVLDIGSSTGGFTQFAITRGAKKVIAVDVGTNQLHPKLRHSEFAKKIELHEKTDIRDFSTTERIDIVLTDVSFISLREILPHVAKNLANPQTEIVAMVKPQFEAGHSRKNHGVIKNETERREILRNFEAFAKRYFVILAKKDSEIAGTKGNRERFYLLKLLLKH